MGSSFDYSSSNLLRLNLKIGDRAESVVLWMHQIFRCRVQNLVYLLATCTRIGLDVGFMICGTSKTSRRCDN